MKVSAPTINNETNGLVLGVDNAQELTQLVQQMLQQMQVRFGEMNSSIVTRIDEMGKKIDELESSIGELVQEAQNESDAPAQKH